MLENRGTSPSGKARGNDLRLSVQQLTKQNKASKTEQNSRVSGQQVYLLHQANNQFIIIVAFRRKYGIVQGDVRDVLGAIRQVLTLSGNALFYI